MEYSKKNIAVFVKNLTSGGAEKQAVFLLESAYKKCLREE